MTLAAATQFKSLTLLRLEADEDSGKVLERDKGYYEKYPSMKGVSYDYTGGGDNKEGKAKVVEKKSVKTTLVDDIGGGMFEYSFAPPVAKPEKKNPLKAPSLPNRTRKPDIQQASKPKPWS